MTTFNSMKDLVAAAATKVSGSTRDFASLSPIAKQNRVINEAMLLYFTPDNSVSLLDRYKAPSAYYVAHIAQTSLEAEYFGVSVGQPTGQLRYRLDGLNLFENNITVFFTTMRAAGKRAIKRYIRAQGVQ